MTPGPATPGIAGGVLNVTKFLLAISVVSKLVGNGGVGVLANSRVWKPPTIGPSVALNDWSGSAEVVEGVVDRRGRVGDRLEAGVIEAREARGRSLAIVEEDRAVLADLREDGGIVGVVGLAGERAGGQLAEDVQGVGAKAAVPKSAPALQIRPGESTDGIGLPPLMSMFITWLPKSLVSMVSELISPVV